MSTHYETLQHADTYREAFAVEPPAALGERHLWPRKPGFFIVHAATATALVQGPASTVSAVIRKGVCLRLFLRFMMFSSRIDDAC